MKAYFTDLFTGAWSLIVGLKVTFKALISPVVTVQYPRVKNEVTPNYRGHIDLVKDAETGSHRCITCGSCMRECPSGCIVVDGEKREGVKGKALTVFTLDFTKCSLCGACVEVCPTQALDYSQEYELAGSAREDFYYDLLKRVEERE
ncbi:NuoI/complex I 23 kDa subunit family protein [Desulfuromonas thiophila]|uniref:NADH-quinone oxidoreductase subunit I n=1 Tax=Desulfuromonas thiophila TaxID=57664 RepID=A0A1G7DG76_9BACT|nr:NADH-quinone oxidoreductase subunit I [Desulfuromonas thiophila]SDE50020.1 NADH dehydrogenase subunit I [Desulfuromonas thiophila]